VKTRLLFILLLLPAFGFASYFSDGMRAYKSGDYETAKGLFELAIEEEGAEQARFLLGLFYLKGLGTDRDLQKAKELLSKAARLGNARAKCYLAEVYLLRKKKEKQRALKLLKEGKNGGALECVDIAAAHKLPL
jgi:TPR repeat protein